MSRQFTANICPSLRRLVFITFIILSLGLLPVYFDLKNFGIIDFTTQIIPFLVETKRLLSEGFPLWSWNTFSGVNFPASYSYYTVTNPFMWIACLFPYKHILVGILLALYLKTICASENRCYLYLSLVACATILINFYFSATSFILGFLYLIFRAYDRNNLNWPLVLKSCGAVLVGFLISSFILVPTIMNVMGSSRSGISEDLWKILGYDPTIPGSVVVYFLPMFKALIMPSITEISFGDSFPSIQSFISNHPYLTLFGFLPTLIYCIRRKGWLMWMILILLICYFTPLKGIFSLFTTPIYCRWLYGFIMLCILATLYLIKDNERISLRDLYIYIAVCIFIIGLNLAFSWLVCRKEGLSMTFVPQRIVEFSLFIINILCLIIWVYNQRRLKLLLVMVALCCSLNLMAFSYACHTYLPNNNKSNADVHRLSLFEMDFEENPHEFTHRFDDMTSFRNISMLQNRPGIYSFHSVFPKHLIPLRDITDSTKVSPTYALTNPAVKRSSMAALMSVKEVRDYRDSLEIGNKYSDGLILRTHGPRYDDYDFEHYIAPGFSYNSYITEKEILALNPDSIDIPLLMLDNLVVKDEDEIIFAKIIPHGSINLRVGLDSLASERRQTNVNNFTGNSKGFKCTSDFNTDRVLFFSVIADPGFNAYIDGQKTEIFNTNLGMMSIVVPKGTHTIEFKYSLPSFTLGLILTCVGLVILCIMIWGIKKLPVISTSNLL